MGPGRRFQLLDTTAHPAGEHLTVRVETFAVPRDCTANSATRMNTVEGMT